MGLNRGGWAVGVVVGRRRPRDSSLADRSDTRVWRVSEVMQAYNHQTFDSPLHQAPERLQVKG